MAQEPTPVLNAATIPMMTTLFSNLWREGRTAFVAALVVQMSVLAWLMLAPVPASAASAASPWVKTEQTELRLIAATETAGAAETLRLGLHFKLKPGWKIYWRSPGDAGFPPVADWSSSKNLKSAVMHWPAPERFSVLGLETLGYKKEVVFPITVTRLDLAKPLHLSGTIRLIHLLSAALAALALVSPDPLYRGKAKGLSTD